MSHQKIQILTTIQFTRLSILSMCVCVTVNYVFWECKNLLNLHYFSHVISTSILFQYSFLFQFSAWEGEGSNCPFRHFQPSLWDFSSDLTFILQYCFQAKKATHSGVQTLPWTLSGCPFCQRSCQKNVFDTRRRCILPLFLIFAHLPVQAHMQGGAKGALAPPSSLAPPPVGGQQEFSKSSPTVKLCSVENSNK